MEIIINVLLLFFISTILWLFEYIFVSVTVPQGKEFFFIFHVFIDIHKTLSDNYCVCLCSVTPSCLTLRSLPGSSVHGILQARILEWVAISSSRGCC